MYQPVALFIGLRYMRGRASDRFGRFVSWLSAIGITLGVLALVSLAGRNWALAHYGLSITHVWPDLRELAWAGAVVALSAVAGLVPALLAYRRTLADGLAPAV